MTFIVTPNHQRIFDAALDPNGGNIMIQAVAGSGKTTTMLELLQRIRERQPYARVCFMAFNTSIKRELEERVPEGVWCRTLNSLGWSALRKSFPGMGDPDGDKVRKFLNEVIPDEDKDYRPVVKKLVGLAKNWILVPPCAGENAQIRHQPCFQGSSFWRFIFDQYGVVMPDDETRTLNDQKGVAAEWAEMALASGLADKTSADFDDQLYMAIAHRAPFTKFDWVLVDECQDLSPVQHELVARSLKPNGRVVAVGDSCQAIYGFRGSDAESMNRMKERFDCQEFPLDVCYRCPTTVLAEAQKVYPHIKARDNAPEGAVRTEPNLEKIEWDRDDLVICRTTAPTVALAFNLIRRNIPCQILGKDIGKGLISLISKVNGKKNQDLPICLGKLQNHEAEQVKRLIDQGKEAKAEALRDKVATIRIFAEGARDVSGMVKAIEKLFAPDKFGEDARRVTLCTVHKAKGLERDRVFILNRYMMPGRWAEKEWEQVQEQNLMYVAFTRAKREMVFISIGGNR